jgi:hypothetical protein
MQMEDCVWLREEESVESCVMEALGFDSFLHACMLVICILA